VPRLLKEQETILEKIREVGFLKVVIDEEGLVSGKLNRRIGKGMES
jgi:PP-loop superfamily ATP-utilizing enzyme